MHVRNVDDYFSWHLDWYLTQNIRKKSDESEPRHTYDSFVHVNETWKYLMEKKNIVLFRGWIYILSLNSMDLVQIYTY